jgi:2-dehydro-3-deoxyphosphooctonate aldolase (KDO 8-P synthase)
MIKKGQFVAPWDMAPLVEKIRAEGNDAVMLCDRGTCFGYNALISDMRSIPIMKKNNVPVCYDASHSVQKPASQGQVTGGDREFIPMLARCAIVAGADALFMETHPEPAKAKSDSATVFPLDQLASLLNTLCELYAITNK